MRLFLVCVCLAGSGANPGLLRAQSKESVSGILHKIDVKSGSITIRPGKFGAKEEKTFSLVKLDIEVVTQQGRIRLADLSVGNVVHLHLNDVEDVDAIRVETPVLRGA